MASVYNLAEKMRGVCFVGFGGGFFSPHFCFEHNGTVFFPFFLFFLHHKDVRICTTVRSHCFSIKNFYNISSFRLIRFHGKKVMQN